MKIKSFQYRRYSRRFRTPLTTSHGAISERTGWIIRIEEDGGVVGFGEAADCLPGFSPPGRVEPDRTIFGRLDHYLHDAKFDVSHREIMKAIRNNPASFSPSIRFGFETALCDLAARVSRMPLSNWISPNDVSAIPVNYLLSSPVDNWDKVKAEIIAFRYPAVKIKVGSGEPADDITTVKTLRNLIDYPIAIRLDANQAWDYATAVTALRGMRAYDIEYVEEPLKIFDPDLLIRLKDETGLEIALDENLARMSDVGMALSMKACDVMILKPCVLGHIMASQYKAYQAIAHERRAVLTSCLETEIGIAAQLHLAAAMPGDLQPCGLDTLRLFESGRASLMHVSGGCLDVPPGHGIGDGIGEVIWNSQ